MAIVHFSPVQKRYASFAFAAAKLEFHFDAGIPEDSHKRDISWDRHVFTVLLSSSRRRRRSTMQTANATLLILKGGFNTDR